MVDVIVVILFFINLMAMFEYFILLFVSAKRDLVHLVLNPTNVILMFIPFANVVVILSIAFALLKSETTRVIETEIF